MRSFRMLLICIVFAALVRPAAAGIFFKKKTPPNPAERVPELIVTVKTDPDEKKRSAAAAELRQYDSRAYADIIPILSDVLQNDAKTSVRMEALQSLRAIRPIAVEAGLAVEHAAAHDPNLRVRMQARNTLMHFRLGGYHTPKNPEQMTPRPVAVNKVVSTTAEPPLAVPDGPPLPPVDANTARPLPAGPVKSPLVPVEAPKFISPPPAAVEEQGPELKPPV